MTDPSREITRLLSRLSAGEDEVAEELMPLLYGELHARASAMMRREQSAVTLQPTALLHEAWVRLKQGKEIDFADRTHFLRLAGRVMRNILVDHARRRRLAKSNGDEALAIVIGPEQDDRARVLDLQDALQKLGERDRELEEVVELRFFSGMTLEETARALGKSVTSVHRAWQLARAFLLRELRRGDHD